MKTCYHSNKWCGAAAVLALAVPIGAAQAAPMQAAPMITASGAAKNDANLVKVQWRHGRHHGWHRHHWRDGYRHRYSRGWGPALGGFVAGAAIGSAVANSRAQAAENNAVLLPAIQVVRPELRDLHGLRRHQAPMSLGKRCPPRGRFRHVINFRNSSKEIHL